MGLGRASKARPRLWVVNRLLDTSTVCLASMRMPEQRCEGGVDHRSRTRRTAPLRRGPVTTSRDRLVMRWQPFCPSVRRSSPREQEGGAPMLEHVDPFVGVEATDLPPQTGLAATWWWPKPQVGISSLKTQSVPAWLMSAQQLLSGLQLQSFKKVMCTLHR